MPSPKPQRASLDGRHPAARQPPQRPAVELSFSPFWKPCWETAPGVVTVFCALASAGPPPCRWRCRWRCSAVCCGRWRCAVACRYRPGVHWRVRWLFYSPPARLCQHTREGPAPRQQEHRVPVTLPKKKERHRRSRREVVAAVAGCFARASMGRPPILQARVAAGSGTGERRCPCPLHRNPG